MGIYSYEEAFGAADRTGSAMRKAIANWFDLYYGKSQGGDPCQRIPYTVVSKIVRTVFGEYSATAPDPFWQGVLDRLQPVARQAMELTLVGGSCFIKPCPDGTGFSFTLIPRNNVLIFGTDSRGNVTDIGTVEKSIHGRWYYTLLERRQVDKDGYLTIQNKLYRAMNRESLGVQVPLTSHPDYARLSQCYRFEKPVHSVGLVALRTPMLNCVDGSAEGVSVYAPAVELIAAIDENEAQLRGEFQRGQSRVIVSRDLLKPGGGLEDHLFVGLDEDPEQVGITVFAPQLRQQAFLARKQEYLRNVESVIGLKRGMLSDANVEERTATEIASSAGDYNLTVMDFQRMWDQGVAAVLQLCGILAEIYQLAKPAKPVFSVDWGNGILYDEAAQWAEYLEMVKAGILKPEVALGWRFGMAADTPQQQSAVREKYMPQ